MAAEGTAMAASVLHTITGLNVGGAEVMLARFLGELDRNSFSSTVLSLLAPGPLGAKQAVLDQLPSPSSIRKGS
jgi:hypothetical protein